MEFDPGLLVTDPSRSILDGAVTAWGQRTPGHLHTVLQGVAAYYRFDVQQPFEVLTAEQQHLLLYGSDGQAVRFSYDLQGQRQTYQRVYEGVIPGLQRRYQDTESPESVEVRNATCVHTSAPRAMVRALAQSLGREVQGHRISDVVALSVRQAEAFFADLRLSAAHQVADKILREIRLRLQFLSSVGLGYLTLERAPATLSGGGRATHPSRHADRFRARGRSLHPR